MKKIVLMIIIAAITGLYCQDLKKAPSFRLENAEGKFIELDSLLTKGPVLINFWASWCNPCKEELPEFYKIKKEFSEQGLNVILITIDKPSNFIKAKNHLKTKGFDFELLKDCDMKVVKSLGGGESIPYTLLIDKSKNIVFKKKGQISRNELAQQIGQLFK